MTSFDQTKQQFKPSDIQLLDRRGEVIHTLRVDATVRRGQWVLLADVSPALRTALVVSEDKRFYEHSGVDWRAASAAAWGNLWNTKTRGASTLTMQLAGLMDDDLQRAPAGRTAAQKLGQTLAATQLERAWRKDQILEAYLNLVPLRGELVGVDAVSRTLFGKAANGLDERDAAITAALVRAPNANATAVARRACEVLGRMQAPAKPNCIALDLITTAALQRKAFDTSSGIAPHVARRLANATPPSQRAPALQSTLQSSLSAPLQRFAHQSLQQHLKELKGRNVQDGAVVVLDNASGDVLAWVGSSGDLSRAAEVDGVTALRQPGSTLKPFLYAQALAEKRITAASLLDDAPTHIATGGGLYIPQNYDHHFKGWVSARTALGASLNVPAVRVLGMVSPEAFHKQLVALGLPLKESGDYYGFSLALGSAEVSLLNLTNAYRALANAGLYSPTTLAVDHPAGPRVAKRPATPALNPQAAFITTDILADPLARARTFGPDSVLATRFWTAVKTGTSKDMRDNWALGFSQRYTVGVWVGNASGAPMWDVSGTTGAAPVWVAVMKHLHQTLPSRAPLPPPGLVQTQVAFEGDAPEAKRLEWFMPGTQQARFTTDSIANYQANTGAIASNASQTRLTPASARITAPTSGTIIALDPDIPPAHQKVTFNAEGANLRWRVDGKPLAGQTGNGPTVKWSPWPGRHVVQVVNAQGKVLDEVRLEVRGAGVRR